MAGAISRADPVGARSLTVLGGSSPFTLGLVEALRAAVPRMAEWKLTLQGRDTAALERVETYARARLRPLGWRVEVAVDHRSALEGCDLVLHQVRYGGLAGRLRGERLAARHGTLADETLGPAALRTALLSRQDLAAVAQDVNAVCPDAWFVNLTNPLSVTTALLERYGVRRCLGVCELPGATARAVAATLDVEPEHLAWAYSGLNHRGFVHHVSVDGADVMSDLVERLDGRALNGVGCTDIRDVGCVPTKYFALLRRPAAVEPRAATLARLRRVILRDLAYAPAEPPASLRRRRTDWYDDAVVPALLALAGDESAQIASASLGEDLAHERRVALSPERIVPIEAPAPPAEAQRWLDRFDEHERRVMDAVLRPSAAAIHRALSADPTVAPGSIEPLARELAEELELPFGRRRGGSRRRDLGDVRVVIQAGGRGERLRPLTLARPKPLLEIDGVAMLERLVRQLADAGLRHMTVLTAYLADEVERHLRAIDGLPASADLEVCREEWGLGTVGGIAHLAASDRTLLMLFGDLVTTLDFRRLHELHVRSGGEMTLASHVERHRLRLGEVVARGDEVVAYREKPEKEYLICSGIAVMEPTVVDLVAGLPPPVGLGDVVNAAVARNHRVVHWLHGALWFDVNDTAEMRRAEDAVRATR